MCLKEYKKMLNNDETSLKCCRPVDDGKQRLFYLSMMAQYLRPF